MVTSEERIEQLKNRVRKREKGSVIVDKYGQIWDPNEAAEKNIPGKETMPIAHGYGVYNAMV